LFWTYYCQSKDKYTYVITFQCLKFLRYLLGITKLGKEKNQCIREKTGVQNIVNKTVPGKVATTRTEDGYK